MQQKCTDTMQSDYFKDPQGFPDLCYVKSLNNMCLARQDSRAEKETKARSFDCIFYQIHPKNINFFFK